jgi:sortase A
MAVTHADVAPSADPGGTGGGDRPGHAPMGKVRRIVREVGLGLITLGVIILLFVAYQLWGTGIAEAHSQASLKQGFQTQVAQHGGGHSAGGDTATVGGGSGGGSTPGPAVTGAIDHLVIPKIGVDKYVVQGVGEDDLRKGPGHYPQTVMPGQKGNAAIAGHRTTYGAPFFELNKLSTGDKIYITDTADREFIYQVSEPPQVVSPNDVAVLDNTPFAQLTLTTCNPAYSATSRLIVFARLMNRPPLAAPKTQPVLQAAVGLNLGKGNSGAWPASILYAAIVILLWVVARLFINRTRRWRRVGAYVAGIGVCLVPLWFCFENVILLLPQNI